MHLILSLLLLPASPAFPPIMNIYEGSVSASFSAWIPPRPSGHRCILQASTELHASITHTHTHKQTQTQTHTHTHTHTHTALPPLPHPFLSFTSILSSWEVWFHVYYLLPFFKKKIILVKEKLLSCHIFT